MNDCNRVAIDQLNKSISSVQGGKELMNIHHIRDDDKLSVSLHSSISMSSSSKSRHSGRSSVSSRAKVAAREAQLANLKLEQAERRTKAKQKQMQEQIEQEWQDLRDQVEYSQLEAQLLADDQVDARSSDSSSRNSKSKAGTNVKELVSPVVVKGAARETSQSSTPHKLSESPTKLEQCDNCTSPPKVSEELKTVIARVFLPYKKILKSQYGHPSSVVKASLKRITQQVLALTEETVTLSLS